MKDCVQIENQGYTLQEVIHDILGPTWKTDLFWISFRSCERIQLDNSSWSFVHESVKRVGNFGNVPD